MLGRKKLLILNGSHSEISLIEEAKKMGYYVITSGNAPELIGHQYADEYICCDYSDCEAMLRIAKEQQITGVCSCANDFGIITASYISEKLGLPGHDSYETTLLLHQKHRFKEFAQRIHLRTPVSDSFDSLEKAIQKKDDYEYPMIVKPVDLSGGKGVTKVNSAKEYVEAVSLALERSKQKMIVVEKFFEGSYHSFSTFLVDQKVVGWFCDNEYSFVNPYFVDTSAGPVSQKEKIARILMEQAEMVAKELKLVNGVFHMQYVLCEDEPYIIDITRRCSGDLYPEPVEHSTGLPWSKWIVMSELGYPSDVFAERGTQTKYCGRHCIMANQNGIIKQITIAPEIKKYIYKQIIWGAKGQEIKNYIVDKAGILFLEYSSEEEMEYVISQIKKWVYITMEE